MTVPAAARLDHVGLFVPEMAAAATALERLGFRLTPFTNQANPGPDGAHVPTGTANRCAMLESGYIEVLTPTGDTPLAAQMRAGLGRYTGLHLIAFGSDAAPEAHRHLAGAGFAPLPIVDLRRPTPDGEARFSVVRVPPGTMAEGRVQFVQHHTPALVWRATDTAHPNRATGLTGILVAVSDPEEAAGRYARFTGLTPERIDGRVSLTAGGQRVDLVDRRRLERMMPALAVPGLPFMAAISVSCRDPFALMGRFAEHGIDATSPAPGRVLVPPHPALGAAILFHAADREDPWGWLQPPGPGRPAGTRPA